MRTALAVGFDRSSLAAFCGTLRQATRLDNHLEVNNDEQHAPVWVCSDLRTQWSTIWPTLRHSG